MCQRDNNPTIVQTSPLSAHESKTNVFQEPLYNKKDTDDKCRSNFLFSYSNNHFSKPNDIYRNGQVTEIENHLPSTTQSKQEGILCTNLNLDST